MILLFIIDVILRAVRDNDLGLRRLLSSKLTMYSVFINLERDKPITYVRYRFKPFLLESLLE